MLGKDLKKLREKQKVSQVNFAHQTGYTKSAICHIERDGADKPVPKPLEVIVKAIYKKAETTKTRRER